MPRPLTSFVGREHELAQVRALLAESRLLTLTGPGGSGKMRLAIRLAAEARDDFPDGVFFVTLAPLRDPDLVVPSVAEILGLDRLDLEHNNLRAALDRLLEAAPVEALSMAAALFWFWSVRGHFDEGRARLAEAVRRAPHARSKRAVALAGAGWLAVDQGDYLAAARLIEEALATARSTADTATEGRAMAFLSRANLGQLEIPPAPLGSQPLARSRRHEPGA